MKVKVGDRLIGEGKPCFIIAEAGVNHNGSIKLAKKLIDAAKDAGADAVKFQTFKTEKIVIKNAEKAKYQKETTGVGESQYGMLKKLELTEEDFRELADHAKEKESKKRKAYYFIHRHGNFGRSGRGVECYQK
jgi:N-acetylneuraminate synthase/N,N'-diacetyllegionaminate synthase